MNVAGKIVEILEEEGILDVFGIPGEQIMPLYEALSKSEINHVLTKHEQGHNNASCNGFQGQSSGAGADRRQ